MINKEKARQNIIEFKFRGRHLVNNTLTRGQNIAMKLREKYSYDDEIALINNYNQYLNDNTLAKYKVEYDEYMAYRNNVKISCE